MGRVALAFEANAGQADARYDFVARGAGYVALLSASESLVALGRPGEQSVSVLRLRLEGAQPAASGTGIEMSPARTSYFLGNHPGKWHTNIPSFRRVKYSAVYAGIDLEYYGTQAKLENDFVVAPGADPGQIRIGVEGAERLEIGPAGELVMKTPAGELRWNRPEVYQENGGARTAVESRYELRADGRVGFALGEYDRQRPLVIDPVLYATYIGRYGNEAPGRIAVDESGNAYVTGISTSVDFLSAPGTFAKSPGSGDVFVIKLNAAGGTVWSAYLGGRVIDFGTGVAVDASGNVYVGGVTRSPDFPVSEDAFRRAYGGTGTPGDAMTAGDGFVAKLNTTGTALLYSTYLGGDGLDNVLAIAVDASGNAYVTGSTKSTNFPTSFGAWHTVHSGSAEPELLQTGDVFITKVNPLGTALVYSTLAGGSYDEAGLGIAVDPAGNAVVTGFTTSPNFPLRTGLQEAIGGWGGQNNFRTGDAFLLKLNAAASDLVFSTYLGGRRDDVGFGVAVDGAGNIIVTGSTLSDTFATTSSAFQTAYRGAGGEIFWSAGDCFVAKFTPAGARTWSTLLGGTQDDRCTAVAVDRDGNVYVTGNTFSSDFPLTPDAVQRTLAGQGGQLHFATGDAFVAKLNAAGSALLMSTLFGGNGDDIGLGIAVDPAGNIYAAGSTTSGNLPTTEGVHQRNYGGNSIGFFPQGDAFVVKLGERPVERRVTVSSIVHAASYAGGGVSPGLIVTLYGENIGPDALAGYVLTAGVFADRVGDTRVLFDGVAAPVVYASRTQTSVIVPYAVAGKGSTQVVVEQVGLRSPALTVPVVETAPGLFSVDATGRGPGAILNQDYTVNTAANPASRGGIVLLYGSGEGVIEPPQGDGRVTSSLSRPRAAVSVTIGGQPADVLYAGTAPGLVAGVLQVNALVPATVASGPQPVVVTIGGRSSQVGVTVAVR
ncbi:MAG: SBBP repeat-containing protein [Acidobacteria bacterium]|nr:SBBP repeat-containing protein [Acidobacteriota bacterium]